MIELALDSLRWLMDVQTSPKGHFEPVGCDGWFPRGGQKALFDQQPIEATGMIDACVEAYRVTDDRSWLDRAQWCFDWFLGVNDLRQPIYDQLTGGCNDALASQGVNENQGAESTLCWLMALLTLHDQQADGKLAETSDGDGQAQTARGPAAQAKQPTASH
jgi:hypothetical protein